MSDDEISVHLDPPDAPDTPEITGYNANFVKLKWEKPKKDGGNPITGYNVEMREKGSNNWVPCNSYPTSGTEYTASGLREGQTYEFRVAAVNGAGPGAPSRPTKPQKAEVPIFAADAPDQPKVEKTTKDSATVAWKKPLNDGGSKITGYILEKRTSDRFVHANRVLQTACTASSHLVRIGSKSRKYRLAKRRIPCLTWPKAVKFRFVFAQ